MTSRAFPVAVFATELFIGIVVVVAVSKIVVEADVVVVEEFPQTLHD